MIRTIILTTSSDFNDTAQWVCVITVLLMVVRWLWKRYHRRSGCSSCCSDSHGPAKMCADKKCKNRCAPQEHTGRKVIEGECDGCPLKNNCHH